MSEDLKAYIEDRTLERDMNSYFNQAFGIGNKQMYNIALVGIGYFTQPASKGHHLATKGGLMRHSVNVTRRLVALTDALGVFWPREESPYLVGMLHDLVKCRCYRAVNGAAQDTATESEVQG